MLKELISARAFKNICEIFVEVERNKDGGFKLDSYDYDKFIDNVDKLTNHDKRLLVNLFGIRIF